MSKKVLVENRENQTEHMRMYYEHQYDRIAKLEDRRLAMTHIVITLSVITFTFGFANPKDLTVITGLGLPVIMLISNLLVITYINRTSTL